MNDREYSFFLYHMEVKYAYPVNKDNNNMESETIDSKQIT